MIMIYSHRLNQLSNQFCLKDVSIMSKWLRRSLACLAVVLLATLAAVPAHARVLLGVEAEDFQYHGGWSDPGSHLQSSGKGILFAGAEGAKLPAVTVIEIPKAGRYTLWVRSMDFPQANPGTRKSTVSVNGKKSAKLFGKSGQAGWSWEQGDTFDLPQGRILLGIHDVDHFYARVDALVLTDDATFKPSGALGEGSPMAEAKNPVKDQSAGAAKVQFSPVTARGDEPAAQLANDEVRIRFLPATRGGKPSLRPAVAVKANDGWLDTPIDPTAESYQVLACDTALKLDYSSFYPVWKAPGNSVVEVEANGVKLETSPAPSNVIWDAGQGYEAIVKSATQESATRVRLDFYPTTAGTLQAWWELHPGEKAARVELKLKPAKAGQYSLGYFIFNRKPLADVQELLLPMMYLRKRFPERAFTMLQAFCPTPVSLMQTAAGAGSVTWGVVADPAEIPYDFPNAEKCHFGLMIRNPQSIVQPSIYGPVAGMPDALAAPDKPLDFKFRVIVQAGDWYGAYRTAADEVLALQDYREAGPVSMTDAALNMIDLYMHDGAGGWWERAKANYQIESKNGSTQASPLTAVSLYRLTGDQTIYDRRALPTLEFMLSRSSQHFSPVPDDTGIYDKGSMEGPVKLYGTTAYGGIYELLNERSPLFREIALPGQGVRPTAGYSHGQEFEEWLARYLLTNDKTALEMATKQADAYIAKEITGAPTEDLGIGPFWLISFTPAWEGLLRMYEVTHEQRFLDAAVKGAHSVMTGMWTQPKPPAGPLKVHPNNEYSGLVTNDQWYKGAERFRLGFPRKAGDVREHEVPAWLVSDVGLGYEQPTTYRRKGNGGLQIFQAPWSATFLRLAEYTGEKAFETYARNAAVGRWANYPGYYITGFTDVMQDPKYPYVGPDLTFFYFHHILPHLSWTIDWIVSDMELRSKGQIKFPSQRQFGYAYFDNRVFGHAPGSIYGEEGAWLWLRRGLVTLDNPQMNYIMAHTADKFFLVLSNQSSSPQNVKVTFHPERITSGTQQCDAAMLRVGDGQPERIALTHNVGSVMLPGHGLAVLSVDGLKISVPTHQKFAPAKRGTQPDFVSAKSSNGIEARAAAIQAQPGPWDAYVWLTAQPKDVTQATLTWQAGARQGTQTAKQYPFEFSVPVAAGQPDFRFSVAGTRPDGSSFAIAEKTVGIGE
jgi:hypothetical protein